MTDEELLRALNLSECKGITSLWCATHASPRGGNQYCEYVVDALQWTRQGLNIARVQISADLAQYADTYNRHTEVDHHMRKAFQKAARRVKDWEPNDE